MRDINRILWVLLVVAVVLLGFVSPPGTLKVFAANTITVTFDPDANVTIDVSPTTQAFGVVYTGFSNYTTATNKFTLYNNGTGPVDTTIECTSDAADMDLKDYPEIYGSDTFGLRILEGTATNSTWIVTTEYRILSNDTAASGTATFGMQLAMGATISSNWTTQSVTLTILGVPG